MNVYKIFKVHGRLIAFSLSLCRIFFRFSRPFSKIFFQRSKKQKSAHSTCLSGAMSAKIRPGDCSLSLISEYIVFKKTALQNRFCRAVFHLRVLSVSCGALSVQIGVRETFGHFQGGLELCTGGNVRIDHQQVQALLAVFMMHGGDEHITFL